MLFVCTCYVHLAIVMQMLNVAHRKELIWREKQNNTLYNRLTLKFIYKIKWCRPGSVTLKMMSLGIVTK